MRQSIDRAANGSGLWMANLSGSSTDPRKLDTLRTLWSDFARITPEELQVSAKRWLVPDKSLAMIVVPEKK